jgi:hypothetical protein
MVLGMHQSSVKIALFSVSRHLFGHKTTTRQIQTSRKEHHCNKDPPSSPTSTMLATSSTLIRRSAPRIVKKVLAQSSKKTFPASASTCVSFDAFYSDSERHQPSTTTIRYFSAVPAEERRPGSVTKTLRILDMDVVKQIMEELRSVDVNSDGR